MIRFIAIAAAGFILCGCTAGATQGAVNLANALKQTGVTACSQVVAAYTPFSNAFCACVSNPPNGQGATITVGTTQCQVTLQPAAKVTP